METGPQKGFDPDTLGLDMLTQDFLYRNFNFLLLYHWGRMKVALDTAKSDENLQAESRRQRPASLHALKAPEKLAASAG